MNKGILLLISLFLTFNLNAQDVTIEGYAFESDNRGYLNEVAIEIRNIADNAAITTATSGRDGKFIAKVPAGGNYLILAKKDLFHEEMVDISTEGKAAGDVVYAKIKMNRKPGYIFDVTVAEKKVKGKITDAITGALIEIYNNTTEQEELVLKDHPSYNFKANFEQGNHYTIMIRKKGYFTKRMEAYVNVEGCILCFDGVGEVRPGVTDNLTAGHEMGTLLANVELNKIEVDKAIKVENIYYDLNKANIRDDAAKELDKLIQVLKDNPALLVELGSHTDSQGRDSYNMELSEKRAQSAVNYIVTMGDIDPEMISGKGYGETKIINKCKNGVECSDRRHQQNRRTELKITGVLAKDPNDDLSLAAMMEAEKFDRMLKELENEEVIMVREGEELPDEIKAQQNKAKEKPVVEAPVKKEQIKEEITAQTSEKIETVETVVDETFEPVKNKSDRPTFPGEVKTEKPELSKKEQRAAKRKKNKDNPSVSDNDVTGLDRPTVAKEKENKPKLEVPVKDPFGSDTPVAKEKEVTLDDFGNEAVDDVNQETPTIIDETPVSSKVVRKPMMLPRNYQGYKVQFYTSVNELPMSHEIFSHHGNIVIEQRKDGTYAYLLGDFENKEQANRFLKDIIIQRYNDARVIGYKNGYRLQY